MYVIRTETGKLFWNIIVSSDSYNKYVISWSIFHLRFVLFCTLNIAATNLLVELLHFLSRNKLLRLLDCAIRTFRVSRHVLVFRVIKLKGNNTNFGSGVPSTSQLNYRQILYTTNFASK